MTLRARSSNHETTAYGQISTRSVRRVIAEYYEDSLHHLPKTSYGSGGSKLEFFATCVHVSFHLNPMIKYCIKSLFKNFGFNVERRDPLREAVPSNYETSYFLPRVYKQSLQRVFYFKEMLDKIANVEGDLVECGTSIGHGLLYFTLISDLTGVDRHFYGFDSFEGFPEPSEKDSGTHAYRGYYANPPEIVLRVLEDGRVPRETITNRVHLVRGFFDQTVPEYKGRIALLHLDCDLYDSYKVCLEHLFAKMVPGGVILFDEYENSSFPGAKKAVDEFFAPKEEAIARHDCGKYYAVKGNEGNIEVGESQNLQDQRTRKRILDESDV